MQPLDMQPPAPEPTSDWGSPIQARALVLMTLTGAGLLLCYGMTAPFIAPLTWALAIAVMSEPLHRKIEARVSRPNLAALLTVLAIMCIVVAPSILLASRLLDTAASAVTMVRELVESGAWRTPLDANPITAPLGRWIELNFDLIGLVQAAGSWLTDAATSMLRGSVLRVVELLLTFYVLFYFLRDRLFLLRALRRMLPLSRQELNTIYTQVFDTVHATVYGTLVVAVVQGTLGGLMFWWLGLPAPILWGVVMGALAVVPVLGAFVVWVPAALFLLLAGHEIRALILVLWGAIVVGGIDNLLYPMLVGNRLKLHTVLAFISIVGGLAVFGAAGLILGPVVFTLTRALLHVWIDRNAVADAQ